jgi:hypothetical protein
MASLFFVGQNDLSRIYIDGELRLESGMRPLKGMSAGKTGGELKRSGV